MIRIDTQLTESLVRDARASVRKRINHNFHTVMTDPLQRMLHALEPGTYVRPHKHENPDKREAFVILRGRVAAVEYTADGEIAGYIVLDSRTGNFGVEFAERSWHSLIALETGSVLFEVKDGPWDPIDDKNFATWAPKEGEEGCDAFLEKIILKLGSEGPS
jgi:cupin fold WbuC family metalloprotein